MKDIKLRIPMNLQFFAEEPDDIGTEGVTEVEPAETPEAEPSQDETESVTEEPAEPQFDTDKANAAFANMRRRAEAAEKRAADLDAMYARQYGKYTNPETGKPITSAADYFEAMAAQERVNARAEMQQKGIDPSVIDRMIANSPAMRQAQAATAELNNLRAQQMMEADFKSVMALDPTKSTVDDIVNDPSYEQVIEYVQNVPGLRFSDAYKIVNFDRLSSSNNAAAKQATINQIKSKSHLSTGASLNVNDTAEEIPASVIENWRDRFPDKSDKELKDLYNRALSSQKG